MMEQPSRTSSNDHPNDEDHLPSILFAIPFPLPIQHHQTNVSPGNGAPFLLYTFPRSVYEKPPIDPKTGKPGKEKLIKKAERVWQQEVKEGEEIKRGEIRDPSNWKRFKGGVARTAGSVIKWMPNNMIETLGRLPPKKKLGTLKIIYPAEKDIPPSLRITDLGETEMKETFDKMLQNAKKQAFKQSIISGCLLPVTLAFDIFVIVPVFAFEVNMAYFSLQANGARKVTAITNATQAKSGPSTSSDEPLDSIMSFERAQTRTFSKAIEYLYAQCSLLDGSKFPPLEDVPLPSYQPDQSIVIGMIRAFQEGLPENVIKRHLLNPDRAAEDLARTLRKAAKEYVNALK